MSWVRSIFKSAVADRLIATSPCTDLKLPAVERPKVVPLPAQQVERLIEAVPVRYKALIILGAGTGVRISEALGLTREPIRHTFSDVWRTAAGPIGIPNGQGYHLLRHFYASVLIEAGESVKVIQDRLHTSAQMTLDIYGHMRPDNDDTTRAAIDGVLGGLGVHLGSIAGVVST